MTASLKEEFRLLDSVELQCSVTGLDTELRIKTKLYIVLHQPLAFVIFGSDVYLEERKRNTRQGFRGGRQ